MDGHRNGNYFHETIETEWSGGIYRDLTNRSRTWSIDMDSIEFAERMDEEDLLKDFRNRFHIPKKRHLIKDENVSTDESKECIYLTGQSLGLQLKSIQCNVRDVLHDWAEMANECHFQGHFPAAQCDSMVKEKMAALVGAEPSEVALMNGLTVNIHLMLGSFYRPTAERHKILMVAGGFHSDMFAVRSQIASRGYDPENSLIFLNPKPREHLIDPGDILELIEAEGSGIALVFLEGVHFHTGQLFDMREITRFSHQQGCIVGFDLAHAVGNVTLHLHEWGVDFGVWCTYKYLNSGPGSMGGIFCHRKHTQGPNAKVPSMAGWWGLSEQKKFDFEEEFTAAEGADRFRLSNPSPILCKMILANLEVFEEAGNEKLREKQSLLTGYLEYLIRKHFQQHDNERPHIQIITPADPRQRGSQLSLMPAAPTTSVTRRLISEGIMCDIRRGIIRVTPIPLYNTYTEVYQFVHILKDIFDTIPYTENGEK